jgi:hypothetical protein
MPAGLSRPWSPDESPEVPCGFAAESPSERVGGTQTAPSAQSSMGGADDGSAETVGDGDGSAEAEFFVESGGTADEACTAGTPSSRLADDPAGAWPPPGFSAAGPAGESRLPAGSPEWKLVITNVPETAMIAARTAPTA